MEVLQRLVVGPTVRPSLAMDAAKLSLLLLAAFAAHVSLHAVVGSVRRVKATRELVKQGVPHPASTLPLLGNTLDIMLYHKHRLHDWFSDQSQASGGRPWVLTVVGKPPTLIITSPELCEDVLKTQFEVFERGPEMIELGYDFMGKGIGNVDGDEWVQQRRTASHLFSTQMLRDVVHDVVVDKTQQICDVLSACARSGKAVSMKSLLVKFASDVFTEVAFGVDMKCLKKSLDGDVEQEHPFIRAIADFGVGFQSRLHSPAWLWKLKRFLNVGEERMVTNSRKIILDLVHGIMSESLSSKTSASNGKPRRDLLTLFVEMYGSANPMDVRDMVVNFLLAGKDTTSFSMSWFFVMINRHPRVLHKIREEIRANIPDLGKRVPTMEELHKLPFLEAAIRESLRLNMTGVHRTSNRAAMLVDGTFVPVNTNVIVSAYASARMKPIWGPDAEEYRPERFLDEVTGELKVISPYKFLSFIGGPRQCLGMRFAMLEMKIALAMMANRFDVKTVEDPFSLTYDFSLVLPVKGDFMVTVREHSATY
jgi:cytochrome P450